jgi:hypothetical protein
MNKTIELVSILLLVVIYWAIFRKTNEGFECIGNRVAEINDWRKFIGIWTPRQNPDDYVLRQDNIYSPQGSPLPLDGRPVLLANPQGPSVNGANAPPALSVFSFNKSSPLCCYGPNGGYSTSQGCVCVTPEQQRWFASVGNNRANGFVGID